MTRFADLYNTFGQLNYRPPSVGQLPGDPSVVGSNAQTVLTTVVHPHGRSNFILSEFTKFRSSNSIRNISSLEAWSISDCERGKLNSDRNDELLVIWNADFLITSRTIHWIQYFGHVRASKAVLGYAFWISIVWPTTLVVSIGTVSVGLCVCSIDSVHNHLIRLLVWHTKPVMWITGNLPVDFSWITG